MTPFSLAAPDSVEEVLSILAEGDEETRLLAGGTGLVNMMKRRLASPARLVSLHRLDAMRGIAETDDGMSIGALCPLLDIEQDGRISHKLPALVATLLEVAGPRIRAMATLGGAVAQADPSQDTPVTLMALDASVELQSSAGTRTVPITELYEDYFEARIAPHEMVSAIHIPATSGSRRVHFKKFTPASQEDYAVVDVSVSLNLDNGVCSDSRVVLGGVGATVFRATEAEAELDGKSVDEAVAIHAASAAAAATDPLDDTRGSADYKRRMTEVMVRRTLLATVR